MRIIAHRSKSLLSLTALHRRDWEKFSHGTKYPIADNCGNPGIGKDGGWIDGLTFLFRACSLVRMLGERPIKLWMETFSEQQPPLLQRSLRLSKLISRMTSA